MKKNIIFVMGSLGIGGAERSLISILSNIDYDKYSVDLMLFNPNGEFKKLLPKEVNILHPDEDYILFDLNPIKSIKKFFLKLKWKYMFFNMLYLIKLTFNRFILNKEYIGWEIRRRMLNKIEGNYDLAIGFLEKKCTYYTVDKIVANKKIGWVHTDYNSIEYDYKLEKKYLGKLNKIIAVSNNCKKTLQVLFPMYKDKIDVIENIVSPELINKQADQYISEDLFNKKENEITIVTVARLAPPKGLDIAIEACKKIKDKGFKIRWYVIGEGNERENLIEKINILKLKNTFLLLGNRVNPYPYIKLCDIYVQPSKWEGFGITVLEAKILNKPIVATNIPEFREQINNNVNGLLFDDIDTLVKSIITIIENKNLANKFIENLKSINFDNSNEINKLLKLI